MSALERLRRRDRQAAGLALAEHGGGRGLAGAGRRAAGRSARGAGRGAAPSATDRGRASATAASSCASGSSSGPSTTTRAAALEHVGAHEEERAAADPLGRAGEGADRGPSAASRQRGSSVRCQSRAKTSTSRPTPDGVAPSWAWRGRAPGTSSRVAGGEVDAALAVAEQVERLGREPVAPSRDRSVRRSPRTGRARRGPSTHNRRACRARRRGAARQACRRPSVVGPAAFSMTKVKAARACAKPFRLAEDGAGAGERGDHQAVPVGEHLVVAAGPRPRPSRSANSFARASASARLLLVRAPRRDPPQHGAALPVAAGRHVVGRLEAPRDAAPSAASISSSRQT